MDLMDYFDRSKLRGRTQTQKNLADILCVQKGEVTLWKKKKRSIPIRHCLPIENATNGLVTRKDLRPKDWQTIWPELDTSAEHPDLIEDCDLPLDQINRAKALFNTGRIKKLSDAAAFFALPKPLALEVFADNLPITKERCEQFHQSLTNKRNSV
ncbi:MAG: hypothetical protein RLY95_1183 [Pseudomonadota bacterium]|jgi:DNA-binding transcriptional regulator YdaS (Cro superfamily)